MAHINVVRGRTRVRIDLYPQDIRDIMQQPEVLIAFTVEELRSIAEALNIELNAREQTNADT